MKRIAAIINPNSGAGEGLHVWKQLEPRLSAICNTLSVRFSSPGEDMDVLVLSLLGENPECLVVVGGDGSLNHAINVLFVNDKLIMPDVKVAYYNAGIGGDFARQFPPQNMDVFLEHIIHNKAVLCDVGKIIFHIAAQSSNSPSESAVIDNDWNYSNSHRFHEPRLVYQQKPRYFMNIASCGLSAHIVKQSFASRASKKLAGRYFYLLHSILGLFSYFSAPVLVVADEGEVEKMDVLLTAVCNGQYFGRNMHIAPDACLKDGLLDVVSFKRMNPLLGLLKLLKLYKGTHMKDKQVRYQQVRSLTINPLHRDIWVEADGDLAGQLPASFELLPSVFELIV